MEDRTLTDRPPRWDNDAVGIGIRDAVSARPAVDALLEAMGEPGWVAEDPEAHLVPHLRAAAARAHVGITGMDVVDGVLELTVVVGDDSPGFVRRTVIGLVAAIAEASTHIRELPDRTFEIVTGMLPGDGHFAPHGHLVRIYVE